jgi:nucleoid-associated protein YgaU
MGLFSFLKNAGTSAFGKSSESKPAAAATPAKTSLDLAAERAAKINALRDLILGLGLKVDNLEIELVDETVTIYGQTETQAEREKVILAAGNVNGISTVDDRISVVTPEPEAQFHVVQSGESLSKIAKKYYGDAMKYPVIFEANKPMLKDPDKIYPGQMLRIPPIQ